MEEQSPVEMLRNIRRRYRWVCLIIFSVLLIGIMASAFHIQFVEGDRWAELKETQKRDSIIVSPTRGNIYSDNGTLMAASVPQYALYMDFKVWLDPKIRGKKELETKARTSYRDTLEKYIRPLSKSLSELMGDKTPAEYETHIRKGFQSGSREYLLSKKRISYFEWKEINRMPFFEKGRNRSGLYTKKYLSRQKMAGSLAVRTIGDVYPDLTKGGRYGLELKYDSLLRGIPGVCSREKIAGKYRDVIQVEPVNGWDLHTTINLEMQDIVETALMNMLIDVNAESGTAILMEVATGRIKAISNLGKSASGRYGETQNYAVSDMSEPGSTFKTVAMLAALEENRVRPKDSVDTKKGSIILHTKEMQDHNYNHGGYGMINAEKSIWYSSNIGTSVLIDNAFHGRKEAGKFVDRIYKMGFNQDLQLEIPGAASPKIPHPKEKNRYWSATDLPWMTIGYVVRIPPIYTLSYYNAIANDGCYLRPYFVDVISRDNEVLKRFSPQVVTPKICSDRALREIRLMLDSVVVRGTGRPVHSDIVPISGKTGTAVLSNGAAGYRSGGRNYQVSFCGYFPSDEAKYSCIVVIRNPHKGYASGGTMSGVVFKQIAEQIYAKEQIVSLKRMSRLPEEERGQMPSEPLENDFWQKGLVPDVSGMAAGDAVYALESVGLRVHVTGYGKVVSQSLPAGRRIRSGDEVYIRLK